MRYLVMPKHLNFLAPITFSNFSSHLANCLFFGSCNLFSLMYAHTCLTTSCLGATSVPTMAASSSDRFCGLVNAPPPPPDLRFGLKSESDPESSESRFRLRPPPPPDLRFLALPHSSPEDSSEEELYLQGGKEILVKFTI